MDRQEALKIVRENYPHFGTTEPWLELEKALATLIPELRESEDERIRKGLIKLLTVASEAYLVESTGIKKKQFFSYLEKQKEQKPEVDESTKRMNENWMKQHFDEQKPNIEICPHSTKSKSYKENGYPIENCDYGLEIAESILEETLGKVEGYQSDDGIREHQTAIMAVKEAMKEQKPAEWSEEDADILNCCISSIEEAKENRYAYKETDGDTSYDREIDWLKSLRPSWKPNEEQMDALKELIDDANKAGWVTPGATELYEQLKKL